MIDLIKQQNKVLKQELIDNFIKNHDKFKLYTESESSSFSSNIYFKFKLGRKILYYIYIWLDDKDQYYEFSRGGYNVKLKSTTQNVVKGENNFSLYTFIPIVDNGFIVHPKSELEEILIKYVNNYIKGIYKNKLDAVNNNFSKSQKELKKLKNKIEKRKDPVDIEKYKQTFEKFQSNLKEFEDFINIIEKA